MNWYTIVIGSWQEFTDLIDILKTHENSLVWYLRGQSDAAWSLRPSLLRTLGPEMNDRDIACDIEQLALKLFQSQAHLYLKPDIIDRNSWSLIAWWSLMQHYSCPTRMLDWTRSPYVAAYFAVDQKDDRDGAVWFFSAPLLEEAMNRRYGKLRCEETIFGGSEKAIYPVLGTQHTIRSAAQQGVFTVSTCILTDHGEAIAEAMKDLTDSNYPTKVIIPARCKHEFLSRLHTMNITAKTLFPGIDGVGRSVSEIVSLRVWRYRREL
jgi:hypothetical protein